MDRVVDTGDLHSPLLANEKNRLAPRRDQPVTCAHCGRMVRRKSRQQRFCGRRCRVSAHRAKLAVQPIKIDARYPRSGRETKPRKKANKSRQLRERLLRSTSRILAPADVIEIEVFGGLSWQRVVSSDGVVTEVAYLRKPTLVSP